MNEPTNKLGRDRHFVCRDCSNKQCYDCLKMENDHLLKHLEAAEQKLKDISEEAFDDTCPCHDIPCDCVHNRMGRIQAIIEGKS